MRTILQVVLCLACCATACGDDSDGGGGTAGMGGTAGRGGSSGSSGLGGCGSNDECTAEEFCESSTSCRERGLCEPRPTSCTLVIDPVCGCDGMTYDNACVARSAGVRVSGEGMCDCMANRDCNEEDYCNGITCDGPGTCTPRPSIESCESMPTDSVGDCSGVGFDNACFVAAAGRRVRPPDP